MTSNALEYNEDSYMATTIVTGELATNKQYLYLLKEVMVPISLGIVPVKLLL